MARKSSSAARKSNVQTVGQRRHAKDVRRKRRATMGRDWRRFAHTTGFMATRTEATS